MGIKEVKHLIHRGSAHLLERLMFSPVRAIPMLSRSPEKENCSISPFRPFCYVQCINFGP